MNICPINSVDETINYNDKKIYKNNISFIIGEEAANDAERFISNVSTMLKNGNIIQKSDNSYILNKDINNCYRNLDNKLFKYEYNSIRVFSGNKEEFDKSLTDIMALYNYLTEGKIAKPQKAAKS